MPDTAPRQTEDTRLVVLHLALPKKFTDEMLLDVIVGLRKSGIRCSVKDQPAGSPEGSSLSAPAISEDAPSTSENDDYPTPCKTCTNPVWNVRGELLHTTGHTACHMWEAPRA